eukprot:2721148-Rhodomonas_salina.1
MHWTWTLDELAEFRVWKRHVAPCHGHQEREVARDTMVSQVQFRVRNVWRVGCRKTYSSLHGCLDGWFVPRPIEL